VVESDGAEREKDADLELVRVSILELVRVCIAPEGAFGVLLVAGLPIGPVTLERTYPLAESAPRGPQFLKIPAGRYRCKRTRFVHGNYDTYEVTGVVGHDRLLFHIGNEESDVDGCIGVGQRFSRFAIRESRLGFAQFMQIMGGRQSFELLVRNA
jgi:hypothetical protein